jgi:cytochrome P450
MAEGVGKLVTHTATTSLVIPAEAGISSRPLRHNSQPPALATFGPRQIPSQLMTTTSSPPRWRPAYPGQMLLRLLRDPLAHLTDVARLGDVVQLRARGRELTYLVNHPELIRDVLVTNQRNFKKGRALERAKLLLGDGLLTAEGDVHRRQRRMIQPEFHKQHINRYGEAMVALTTRRVQRWTDGQQLDMHAEMAALTLAIAGNTLFGSDVEHESAEIATALDETFTTFMRTFYLPFGDTLLRLPLPSSRRFWRSTERLLASVDRLIAERRASPGEQADLLSLLLRVRDTEGDGAGMTDQQVKDEVLTFFLAGHETTANALAWSWYLLALHPEAADQVAAEAQALGSAPLTADDYPRLPWTRMVFAESMRLYPPAWAVARRSLGPCDIGGYQIPADALVVMSQWVVHRDARWWPEPDRFDPERWRAPDPDRAKFAYFPFGGGARMCIGEHFAWLEGVLVLATIARDWRMSLAPQARVGTQATITLRPRGGIPLQLHRRSG